MDYNYINQLLDCYWQGETSLEEEEILRTFFSQDNIPAELRLYKPLFAYQAQERKHGASGLQDGASGMVNDVLGDDFDARILRIVEQEESSEARVKARVISLPERLKPLFKAAAMVAIILTLGNAMQVPFSQQDTDPISSYDGYYKPQLGNGTNVAYSDSTATDTLQQSMVQSVGNDGM